MKFVNLILNEMNVLSTKDTGRNMVYVLYLCQTTSQSNQIQFNYSDKIIYLEQNVVNIKFSFLTMHNRQKIIDVNIFQ